MASDHDHVIYVYTAFGRVYGVRGNINIFYKFYCDYLKPEKELRATVSFRTSTGSKHTVRGDYSRIYHALVTALEKPEVIESARFLVFIPEGGVERMINAYYGFTITGVDEAKLVTDNAFSARRWSVGMVVQG